jgi:hypothetical protein
MYIGDGRISYGGFGMEALYEGQSTYVFAKKEYNMSVYQ